MENQEKYYIYTMVRRDISPEQRAVQACHASFELGLTLQDSAMRNATLVLLGAPTNEHLERALAYTREKGINPKVFFEPDMGGVMTSWACIVKEKYRKYFESYRTLKYNRGFMWQFVKFCKAVWREWND